jgi:hypothetical protein
MENKPDLKAEIDFKDLLRMPSKLFGYSYIYFIVILGGLGYLYVDNLTVIGKNSVSPVVLKDSSSFIQDIALQIPQVLQPVDIMKVSVPTPNLLQKGKELFQANCSSCHGDNGEGNGSAAATLNPKPRNFRSLQGWTNGPNHVPVVQRKQYHCTNSYPGGGEECCRRVGSIRCPRCGNCLEHEGGKR